MNDKEWINELLGAALIAVVMFIAIQLALANFQVEGTSMQPSLQPGNYLMVSKLVYASVDAHRFGMIIPFWQPGDSSEHVHLARQPRRGDVIVFNYPENPERQFVKRIIAEPGQQVYIHNGYVVVDGRRLDEPYLNGVGTSDMHTVHLNSREYFVMGDNRGASQDSRHWGPLPADHIIGKVWAIYWPRSAWGIPR